MTGTSLRVHGVCDMLPGVREVSIFTQGSGMHAAPDHLVAIKWRFTSGAVVGLINLYHQFIGSASDTSRLAWAGLVASIGARVSADRSA